MRPARSSYRVDLDHGSSASVTDTFHRRLKKTAPIRRPRPQIKGEIFRDGLPVWGPTHQCYLNPGTTSAIVVLWYNVRLPWRGWNNLLHGAAWQRSRCDPGSRSGAVKENRMGGHLVTGQAAFPHTFTQAPRTILRGSGKRTNGQMARFTVFKRKARPASG